MIYMLVGLLVGKLIMSLVQYYTFIEMQSNNFDKYPITWYIRRIIRYSGLYGWKDFLIGILNIILWCLIWKLEGINLYSIFISIVTCILLTISIIDIKCMIIPDSLTFSIFILGLFFIIFDYISILHAIFGFLSVSTLLYVVYIFTKQKGIGGGDIKLMAVCGIFLGVQKSILALEIACILSLIVQGCIGIIKQHQAFAFGPYLSIGVFSSLLIGDFIIQGFF